MVVTDNGANMVKCARMAGSMSDDAEELAESGLSGNVGDDDEDDDDKDASDTVDETFDDSLQLKRFLCIAHTLQLQYTYNIRLLKK